MFLRLLGPLGLHHIFYLPFWTTALGGSLEINGLVVEGTQKIFFAQLADPSTVKYYEGVSRFMSGRFITMMFGLPGAALAIYQCAKVENRAKVVGLLFSAALTSFLTGITEPLEFSFLFVAPMLYLLHAFFDGLAFMVSHLLNITVGQTFSGGFIDFILFGVLQGHTKTNYLFIPIIGVVWFFLYYCSFKFFIKTFNLKILGREDAVMADEAIQAVSSDQLNQVIEYLGGKKNIIELDCCATRLRLTVVEPTLINGEGLKTFGSKGIIIRGQGVQIIYGPSVTILKNQLEEILRLEE